MSLKVVTLVFFGSLCLGGALPQIGLFISASTSAADVFEIIDQVRHNYVVDLVSMITTRRASSKEIILKALIGSR